MRVKFAAATILLFAVAAFVPVFGQAESKPAVETFVIAEQPDSPLTLTLERQGGAASSMSLKLTNTGTLAVRGYVVRLKGEDRDDVYTAVMVNRFHEPGKSLPLGVTSGRVGNVKPQTVEISLDYVEFTDGTKWGRDSFGRSKRIADYINGHETAKTKLAELLAGHDGTEIMKHVEMLSGHTFGEPAPRMALDQAGSSFKDTGYVSVVRRLQQMKGPRAEEAKELARRLELVQKSGPR